MSCVPLQHRFPDTSSENGDLLSWRSIAAMVRNHARSLPRSEADEILGFADLLDGFAELQK
jgi:hypothetical protein